MVKFRLLFGYFVQSTFLSYQVHFAKSQSQQCPIVKSIVPSQHSQATNSTPPRQHCQIVKSKFVLWTAHNIKHFWAARCLNFFRSIETSAQTDQTLSKFKLPSKLNFNILRANWKVLSSHFIFSLYPFLWTMWIESHINGTKVHPWKFVKNEIHFKNITYKLISSMKYSLLINFFLAWKVHSLLWCIQ
jgi:hypothetical protein